MWKKGHKINQENRGGKATVSKQIYLIIKQPLQI